MRTLLRRGAIALALTVAASATAVQATEAPEAVVAGAPSLPEEDITGGIDRIAISQSLPLTDEERGLIFVAVLNLPDVPDADLAASSASAALPETIEIQELPAMLLREIPLLRGHKFVKADDRILVVRPTDRIVVAQIPRYRLVP